MTSTSNDFYASGHPVGHGCYLVWTQEDGSAAISCIGKWLPHTFACPEHALDFAKGLDAEWREQHRPRKEIPLMAAATRQEVQTNGSKP